MILISIPLLLFSIVIHGWVANRLGDPTAKQAGRLTLNPLAHIDPVGTVMLPLIVIMLSLFSGVRLIPFGWAKPVPINFARLRNPKKGIMLVSAAGIAANLLLAFCFAQLLRIGVFPADSYGMLFLSYGILINLVLAVLNAIPIPPLDGSKIVLNLLPR
ncbi:site-2 protease family protein, partial [Candidatus Omnitrophota bacterium]